MKKVTAMIVVAVLLMCTGCSDSGITDSTSAPASDSSTSESSTVTASTTAPNTSRDSTTASAKTEVTAYSDWRNEDETGEDEDVSEFIELIGAPDSFEKTGDNYITDDPSNEFVSLVSEEYGVEPELLVAIFALPDTGNNLVLEFYEMYDEDGELIRSPQTLYKVYWIDQDGGVSVACNDRFFREGVSYWESYFCLISVSTVIMPQHPEYFTCE